MLLQLAPEFDFKWTAAHSTHFISSKRRQMDWGAIYLLRARWEHRAIFHSPNRRKGRKLMNFKLDLRKGHYLEWCLWPAGKERINSAHDVSTFVLDSFCDRKPTPIRSDPFVRRVRKRFSYSISFRVVHMQIRSEHVHLLSQNNTSSYRSLLKGAAVCIQLETKKKKKRVFPILWIHL